MNEVTTKYDGPICFVGHDHQATDGRDLEGGWHYTVVVALDADGNEIPPASPDESPPTMPGEKLTLVDGSYRLAKAVDKSHQEKHHKQHTLVAVGGGIGDPKTADEIEATRRHLDELMQRIGDEGVHAHEQDHILTTPDEISAARHWVDTLGEKS